MKTSYGVIWREQGLEERTGQLVIGPQSIQLVAPEGSRIERELLLDEIVAVELRTPPAASSRSTLVLETAGKGQIELDSSVDKWIMNDLAEKLLAHGLRRRTSRRILVALKLGPGSLDTARRLLQQGPPFDPASTALTQHDAFLLDDEALFLFETEDPDDDALERLFEPDLWHAGAAWRELMTGEVRVAEQGYSWRRHPRLGWHPGLGF